MYVRIKFFLKTYFTIVSGQYYGNITKKKFNQQMIA
jgi:hypothetical protein